MDFTLETIREHGDAIYSLLFTYTLWNNLIGTLIAGYAAHHGVLDWMTLIGVCWAGAFVGDTVRFWIGRRWGHSLVRQFPKIERGIGTVLRLVDRHHLWMVFVHRYPNGLRGLAGFAYGMAGISWPRFLALNLVTAGIWSASVIGAGYSFGHLSEKMLGDAASGLGITLLAVFLAIAWLLSKKLQRVIERG